MSLPPAPPAPGVPSANQRAIDCDLLRRFEPVIRYARGERFFPMDVDRYVSASSLWMYRDGEPAALLVPEGQLTLERLAEPRRYEFGVTYFMQFIEPLNITEMAAYAAHEVLARKDPLDLFHAGRGRLARVGYGSRLVDALFSITLLMRGRVPGDTAAAAAQFVRRILTESRQHCYYGRVVREAGWTALQYWFFYPFNNWRSGFFGVNDHEADWEMVYMYLADQPEGEVQPEWVAYASHDFVGDDLRRRWDDPEVEKVGEHPVIYAGAGSHASYYSRGDYLAEIELPFLAPLVRASEQLQRVGRRLIRESLAPANGTENEGDGPLSIFRVPFVDYARGDGLAIGPGGDRTWADPAILDSSLGWAMNYRGLWGLYAHDPIAGENAPAGPVYNRDGTMRRSWYDPLGWAGLDKVPPRGQMLSKIDEQLQQIREQRGRLEANIQVKNAELTGLGVEAEAMVGHPHLRRVHTEQRERIATVAAELRDLRAELAADEALREALELHAADVRAGYRGPARAHIHRAHHPTPEAELRLDRFAEFWAAISIGLVMVSFVALVLYARHYLLFGLAMIVTVLVFAEASFRRRLARLVDSIAIALAVVSTLVLLFEFFWQIVVVAVVVAGSYIMWDNIRELRA